MRSPPSAFDTALRLLSQRAHGEQELRRKLARRGCAAEEVEPAMVRLRELGYLDDAAFTEALVAYRARSRGPALIAAELASKGIPPDLARRAVAHLDRDQLVAAARRRAGAAGATDPRRAAIRLLRLGYARDVVREALAFHPDDWEPEA